MRIAICDDVKEYNDKLNKLLNSYIKRRRIDNCKVMEYTSGLDLLEKYRPGKFNLIFLDVDMPDLSGFETAEQIRKQDLTVDIIFVTYMYDQTQMGYSYNAKGYLYKDINQEQIDTLMDRLMEELERREDIGFYKIRLKFDGVNMLLPLSDVLYFESKDKDILAVTEEDAFVFRGQLKNIAEDLKNKSFIRIHRSYLVNVEHIFAIFGNYLVLRSNKDEKLPISKKYSAKVNDVLRGRW